MKQVKQLLFALLAMMPAGAWAQDPEPEPTTFTVGNFKYTVTDEENKTVSIGKADEAALSGALVLPSSVTNESVTYTVTSITASGFQDCSELTTITLPNTLVTIGGQAFYSCSSLTSFSVPASVTTIESSAFDFCSIADFTFEESNTPITCDAVIPCSNHLNLYRNITRTGGLTEGGVKTLTVGAAVTTIYQDMFSSCTLLSSIDFSAATGLTSIGEGAFYNCGNAGNDEEPVPNLTTIDLSNTKVTSIGDDAFQACSKLKTVTLPNTLITIGGQAFYSCSSLTSFSVPASVTTIESSAFDFCSIADFTFEESNTPITCDAVIPCSNHLNLYRNITRTGGLTEGGVKTLTVGAAVTTIYQDMFSSCTLLSSIDFSAATGLTSIGEGAFYNCGNAGNDEEPVPNLTTIDLSNTKVTSIGDDAFQACSKLKTVTLPNTLITIGGQAFYSCSSLTSFSVPASVTTIGSSAFEFCEALTDFTFEESNTTLTCDAYIACGNHFNMYRNIDLRGGMSSGIQTLTIGANVTNIGTMFSGCDQITNVIVPWLVSPITIAEGAFDAGTYTNATLWIPGGTRDVYEAADVWKDFGTIGFSSFVVSITGSAHGTLAVADISSTNNETATTLIARETDAVFTVTPATGYELTTFTVNSTAQTPTEGSYTVENLLADQTVVAGFTPITYNLSYTLNGGSVASANPTTYTIESAAITLTNPTREGYTFAGWTGTGLDAATTTVTISAGSIGDRSYTATWTPTVYNINLTLNGGTVATANPTTYTIESAAITLNNPTKTGYTFAGWKLNGAGDAMMSVTIAAGSTGDKAYTATWTPITYTISYNLDGGSVATANPTSYTIESAAITLNNPTKEHYDFAGWTGTGLDAATQTVTIAAGSTGNRSYTATWTTQSYTVSITGAGVTADNMNPEYLDDVVITVASDPDRSLTSLTVNGEEVKEYMVGNTYTIESVTGNITVVATFTSTKEFITLAGNMATFCCTQDLDFSEVSGLKAYIASGYNKTTGQVLLTRVMSVPANTGLLLVGTAGTTYKVPYVTSNEYYVNLLVPVTVAQVVPKTDGSYTNFLLSIQEGVIGFYKSSGEGTVAAGKAYLQVPTAALPAGVKGIELSIDDVTPVQSLKADAVATEGVYDIYGRQIPAGRKLTRGIYVINGKKVSIK